MTKPVILTGLRANSDFHLGNYLGGILPMVNLQKKHAGTHRLHMFVPDLHSFTTPIDHFKLYQQSLDNLKLYIAAGLDVQNADTCIYRQSFVPAHSELTWILDCFTHFGEASRMIEFKDKSQRIGEQGISVGLFNYPVLMAADILLYDAKWVPVGEDQRQHLELTRDIGLRMNKKFGDLFAVPEPWESQLTFAGRENVRIRSLRNPDRKMSKSVEDPAGTIMLGDKPEVAAKKILGAATDSIAAIHLDWEKQPGISNLLQILALLSDKTVPEVTNTYEGQSHYGHLKQHVADHVSQLLTDLQSKLDDIDEHALMTKLESDEKIINHTANAKLFAVQKAVGLRP